MTRNTKKTLVVNLIGEPCTGKSVLAAELFAALKKQGLKVELVQEYAKDLTWGEDWDTLGNQAYVTSKQFRRQCRVDGKVDVIVTDTSLLLGAVYRGRGCGENFDRYLMEDLYGEFWNLNLWLERGPEIPYQQDGRKQNEVEAAEKAVQLRKFLANWRIPSITLQTGKDALLRACTEIEASLAAHANLQRFGGPLPELLPGVRIDCPDTFAFPHLSDYELNKG